MIVDARLDFGWSGRMNWSSDPPRISGWWFVGAKAKKRGCIVVDIVVVREHRHKWQWRFINGLTWNLTDKYPKYKWAGPISSPSLENFNRAK